MAGTDPTPIERRFLGMIDMLKQVGAIKVGGEEQGYISQIVEDSVAGFAWLAKRRKITLDPGLVDHHVRFSRLGIRWWCDDAGGEFALHELIGALAGAAPDEQSAGTDEERALFLQLRVIDHQPDSGVIAFEAAQVRDGTLAPHVWMHRFPYGTFELDIDYPGYLEALLLTKGLYGWPFLYADVRLGDPGYVRIVRLIRSGLDFLHDRLPDPGLGELEIRLAERLR